MFLVALTLVFFPLQMQGYLLVEEKEQQTWRILEQQGISLYGLVLVKALLISVLTFVFVFFISSLSGLSFGTSLLVCLFITPVLLIMLSIGTVTAALTKNKIEISIWETPIVIIFISLEIIHQVLSNNGWSTFLPVLPNHHFYHGLTLITDQRAEAFLSSFFYFLIWSAAFIFLASFVLYRYKQKFQPRPN